MSRLAEIEALAEQHEGLSIDSGPAGHWHGIAVELIAMVKVANRGSESLRKFNERATGRNQELERQLTDALAAHATILKECQKLISERDTARARIAALERENAELRAGKNDLVLKAYPKMDALDRVRELVDRQPFQNSVLTVAQLRRAMESQ